MQNRCGFESLGDIWVEDILNLGVSWVLSSVILWHKGKEKSPCVLLTSESDDLVLHFVYYTSPAKLVEIVKRRFISLGGVILEDCSLSSIVIYDDVAVSYLMLSPKNIVIKKRIQLIDMNCLDSLIDRLCNFLKGTYYLLVWSSMQWEIFLLFWSRLYFMA